MNFTGRLGTRRAKPKRGSSNAPQLRPWVMPLTLAGLTALWALVVRLGDYAPFILPGPGRVSARFFEMAGDGSLWQHSAITLAEASSHRVAIPRRWRVRRGVARRGGSTILAVSMRLHSNS